MRKRVAILGSTGSIGTQALDVIARYPDRFEVVALAAGRNTELLAQQVTKFKTRIATTAADGAEGLMRAALESDPDIVLAATDGAVAFDAVFAAVDRGIDIALANKELIVAAGDLLVAAAKRGGARLLPVDSEHSAIFQCLVGEDPATVAGIVLTASGGPFRTTPREEMERATVAQALNHPTWRMGTKNTIDSATMMNKGLEAIEASRLFDLPADKVHIVVHPQSIAHGFAIFTDGNVKGQMAYPDMRLPIGYALSYPERLPDRALVDDVMADLGAKPGALELRYDFERPDPERFPCLRLAYQAMAQGGTVPAVLSAANEVAVGAFVEGRIAFGDIARIIEATMERVPRGESTLAGVRAADREARETAAQIVKEKVTSPC
jgi:1-deoxy-D-xylulose-5-phosphate reductoisomerase